ncbi:forkhead box protein B2-like [Schistocerca piceifrons]|uniref:forkhead box protein B2-like n=1 Tax=Schistocerca piceifrons TaxID=274613 RepID=UPI001F5EF9C2|nr:forkhead box protein B2-like [Schistocerca piceifrons]
MFREIPCDYISAQSSSCSAATKADRQRPLTYNALDSAPPGLSCGGTTYHHPAAAAGWPGHQTGSFMPHHHHHPHHHPNNYNYYGAAQPAPGPYLNPPPPAAVAAAAPPPPPPPPPPPTMLVYPHLYSTVNQNQIHVHLHADRDYAHDPEAAAAAARRADPEKSGFSVFLVNSGLTKNAQKVDLAMFATTVTLNIQIDPKQKFYSVLKP